MNDETVTCHLTARCLKKTDRPLKRGEKMKRVFKSWRAYWGFQRAVQRVSRYFRTTDEEAFLKTVLATSKSRHTHIECDKVLWRAQLGHNWDPIKEDTVVMDEVPYQYPPERMWPLRDSASEGRANPKGIPYLYMATDKDTALAEVRPWIGSLISIGMFKTTRNLKVVNCAVHKRNTRIYFKQPSPSEREAAVWADIDQAFSKPVTPSDKTADYVPTQIIAELFKDAGLDGVAYKSALGDGINLVLFDLDAVELLNCSLYEATSLKFEFKQTTNTYYIKKKRTKIEEEDT